MELAKLLGSQFADADDYHSEASKSMMRQGIPLNDSIRLPWLQQLHNLLLNWHRNGLSGVLACSALKRKYRHLLNSGLLYGDNLPKEADINGNIEFPVNNLNVLFVLLSVDRNLIEQRIRSRNKDDIVQDVSFLDSQFRTLEVPLRSEDDNKEANTDNISDESSYLSVERSELDLNLFYLIYVLKCTSEKSVNDIALSVVNYLSNIPNLKK